MDKIKMKNVFDNYKNFHIGTVIKFNVSMVGNTSKEYVSVIRQGPFTSSEKIGPNDVVDFIFYVIETFGSDINFIRFLSKNGDIKSSVKWPEAPSCYLTIEDVKVFRPKM